MEVCCTATIQTFFQFRPVSLYPVPYSLQFLNNHFIKPIMKTHHFSLVPSQRTRFIVSAAPATVDNTVSDKLPADLQITETLEPNSRVRISVEVPSVVCQDCYRIVIKEFTKQSKVPGFRPGKVPEEIIVNFVGEENVKKTTIESILQRTLPHAMSSASARALEDSIRISTNFEEMDSTYSSMKFLKYDVIVDVAPELKWVPEDGYKNLKIRVEALGSLRIVTDRGLKIGDVAILDISAETIEEDESVGQKIPSAESKGFQFDTEEGDKVLPDFVNSIIGIKRGETKSFPYVFPDTWNQEDLRAQFTVDCKELFYRDLPELNDSIADKVLSGCTTIDEVKEILLQKFMEVEQTAKEQATDNAILDQLHKMVDVEIPQSLFEELYGAQLLQMQANMKLNEQQLASLSSPKAVREFLENQKENLTNIIKQNLAVGDIFKRENMELVKEVENSIAEFKRHKQEYDDERIREQVQEVLEGAKVLEWLRERTDIQYITK